MLVTEIFDHLQSEDSKAETRKKKGECWFAIRHERAHDQLVDKHKTERSVGYDRSISLVRRGCYYRR